MLCARVPPPTPITTGGKWPLSQGLLVLLTAGAGIQNRDIQGRVVTTPISQMWKVRPRERPAVPGSRGVGAV